MTPPFDKLKGKLNDASEFLQSHKHILSDKMGDDRFIYINKKRLEKENPSNVSGLKFEDKGLTDESVPIICEIIKNAPNLQEIFLQSNKFTANGIGKILTALENHTHFKTLNISENPLGNSISPVLSRFLNTSKSIKSISAANVGMDDGAMAEMLGAAGNCSSIRELYLAENSPKAATSSAVMTLLKKNPNLTTLSLTGNDWQKADGFADAFSTVSHRNLTRFTPSNDKLRELTDRNQEAASNVVQTLSEDLDGLNFQELCFVANRLPSAYKMLEWKLDKGEALQNAQKNFSGLMEKMPSLPQQGSDLKAFFTKNEHGYTALDNPRLWQHPNAEERLAELKITREDLTRKTEKGASLLESLAHGMPAEKTITFLNKQDIKLGARELLDSDGVPNATYKAFIERNDIAPLFSLGNWVGKTQNELRATMEPLTTFQQKQVPFHSLTQEMRRFSPNQGLGR